MHLTSPEIYQELGAASLSAGDFSSAIRLFRHIEKLRTDNPAFYCQLGNALFFGGAFEQGMNCFYRALEIQPGCAEAHLGLAFAFLTAGDFLNGWPHYEYRSIAPVTDSGNSIPLWNGEPLHGQRILLRAEQGLGDTIQFVRYATLAASQGGRVILQVQPPLNEIMKTVDGVESVLSFGQSVPRVSLQAPLLSVPRIFKTTVATIPQSFPYLKVSPSMVKAWSSRIVKASQSKLKVGLVWAGEPRHIRDRERSILLKMFEPLLRCSGAAFFSLQKGAAAAQLANAPADFILQDLEADCDDITQTAAAIMALDLVISVDTSVAHLAGALGKPVWILLPFVPDWRWLLQRNDSPWYPTAKLFRQPTPGAWERVIQKVAEELQALANSTAPAPIPSNAL